MGIIRGLVDVVDKTLEALILAIPALIVGAYRAIGAFIDFTNDILENINRNLKDFLSEGATEVNVIKGNAFSDFVKFHQAQGKYTEVSLSDLNAMRNNVINVAMDNNGRIKDGDTITSERGLSSEANQQFMGQPMMKIKI